MLRARSETGPSRAAARSSAAARGRASTTGRLLARPAKRLGAADAPETDSLDEDLRTGLNEVANEAVRVMLSDDIQMLTDFKAKVDYLGEFLVGESEVEAARFMLVIKGMLNHELLPERDLLTGPYDKAFCKIASLIDDSGWQVNRPGEEVAGLEMVSLFLLLPAPAAPMILMMSSFRLFFSLIKAALPFMSASAWIEKLEEVAMNHLEDSEARVRLAVSECLFAIAQRGGLNTYDRVKIRLFDSIERNLQRNEESLDNFKPMVDNSDGDEYMTEVVSKGTQLKHDTEGWKCLETSFTALQRVMEGCGDSFSSQVDDRLKTTIERALAHKNRFVRETGYFTLSSLSGVCRGEGLRQDGQRFAEILANGLADNWSQVRYAASVATRAFLESTEGYKEQFYPILLPAMCLNRYYVAEGVRLYSQNTWATVMGNAGRRELATYAPQVVAFYIKQSRADNHAVREAACYCIAELMCKVDHEKVSPFVPQLLEALIDCFKDASWPVRDAACTACGRCIFGFPEESRVVLPELFDLWFAHLVDNISSVRQDSAAALGSAMKVYKDEAIAKVVVALTELLPLAKEQPDESRRYGGLDNVTHFGVAHKKLRDNDQNLHTDQTMYSCGSLTAKAGSTTMLARGGGCMDHGFSRAKEPWEASDGAIYLLKELALASPHQALQFMPTLADLVCFRFQPALSTFMSKYIDDVKNYAVTVFGDCRTRHFGHYHNLLETLYKQLPHIAEHIGKRPFKQYLDIFIEPLFFALSCGQRAAEVAAEECLQKLQALIGPSIFAARLTDEQRAILSSRPPVPAQRLGHIADQHKLSMPVA
eukprot:SM000111S18794  [mRNA]  locus=s111:183250:196627:+ [translate_table: standard]